MVDPIPSLRILQSFTKVYEILRDEMMADDLVKENPLYAREWFKEVRSVILQLEFCNNQTLVAHWVYRSWTTMSQVESSTVAWLSMTPLLLSRERR
jgi:hypothetical protein